MVGKQKGAVWNYFKGSSDGKTFNCIFCKVAKYTKNATFESMIKSKNSLQSLALNEEAAVILEKNNRQTLLDNDGFWGKMIKLHKILKPIKDWITILEGDRPCFHLVVEAFNEIQRVFDQNLKSSSISVTESKLLLQKLLKRREESLLAAHFAANLLDPKKRGTALTDAENLQAVECIVETGVQMGLEKKQLFEELGEYKTKCGLWSSTFMWSMSENMTNIAWWSGMCGQKLLHKVALRLLSLPATSAASERSFSTHGWIHNSLRNRLHTERAAKIVYIAHNTKSDKPPKRKNNSSAKKKQPASTPSPSKPITLGKRCVLALGVK